MPRFFAEPEKVSDKRIIIEGDDVNHISRVLRMRPGEELTVSDGTGMDYLCTIGSIEADAVVLDILNSWPSYTELPVEVTLFQGLPKADKMELIIQKTIELGVHEIVPVAMSRCIVKLDAKKAAKRTARWQGIAEAAAKQSGRSIIPEVTELMTYGEAMRYAGEMDAILFPYENAKGITETRNVIDELKRRAAEAISEGENRDKNRTGDGRKNKGERKDMEERKGKPLRVAVFIGPEGGFSEDEVAKAEAAGARIITLGKRILRTETAGLAVMSILMYELEAED